MSKRTLIIFLFLALQGFTNVWSRESSKPKKPTLPNSAAYLGQTPPGEAPVLFAPDLLTSLSAFAGAPTFSPDGTKCFVSVGAADYSTPATLCYSEWTNNTWRPFVKAPFVLDFNSSCESVFSADGHTLTFTGKKTTAESTDFWTVDFTAQGWSTPVRMPSPINSGANEWRGSTTTDGTMYFGSERDKPGMYQVYKAYRDSGRNLVVEKLGLPINMNALEGDPCVAPDGHFLIFCSGRNGNSTDLFVSFRDGKGGWGTPIHLGPAFNTGNDEYGAYLTHDGKYLFFTRHTPQGDGTYWVAASALEKLMAENPAGKVVGNASAGPAPPSYAIPGKPSDVLQNHEAVLAPALQVQNDLKVAVKQVSPQDKASLVSLNSALFTISLLESDFAGGRRYLEAVRESQEPGASKVLTGVITGPYIQAMEAPGADFHATFRAALTKHLAELPYMEVEGTLKAMKDSVAAASKELLVASVVASLDPAVKDGRLGQPMAARLLSTAMNLEVILPVKDDVVAALDEVIHANQNTQTTTKQAAHPPLGRFPSTLRGAYFGLALPGETPVPFAPEILGAVNPWVEATAFSPDGTRFFLGVASGDFSSAKLYYSRRVEDVWTPLAEAPFVSGFVYSAEPVFSADGATLTFTGMKAGGSQQLWSVGEREQGWGAPVALPSPIYSGSNEWRGSYSSAGTMYFGSTRSGMMQVYKACRDAAQSLVVNLVGPPVSMQSREGDPCIAPDGRFLVFFSRRGGGYGGADLYASFTDGQGGWKTPINLGEKFNSPDDEHGAHLSSHGKVLFFTRHTAQGNSIYWVAASAIEKFETAKSADLKGPYFGQRPPGETATIFAPGTLSLATRLETYLMFSPDGKTLFFTVVNPAWTEGKILWGRLTEGGWSPPEVAPFSDDRSINWETSLSPDGRRVFFASNRPPSSGMDLWMAERTSDSSWSVPVRLPETVNSEADDGSACVTNNGALYFKSSRGGGIGGSWLYRAKPKDGAYSQAESLGKVLRTGPRETEPYVSPDESYLVFSSETREGGRGGWDLWVSFRTKDGAWSEPVNLGTGVNTPDDEYGPRVTPDGKYLFFTREKRGETMDIYWVGVSAIEKLAPAKPMEVKGPYFGQRPPGETPEPFAPEFLSAQYGFVARIAFSPDGNECYFTVTDATYSHPKILVTRRSGDLWSEPVIPDFADPKWINHEPFFSQDGTKLYFSSNRDARPDTNKRDFWRVERTAKGWSEPKRLPPPINSDFIEFFYSQATDGTAYFCSNRPGGIGAVDLYRVRQAPGQPASAENLGPKINSPYSTGDPCIAADGRFLVFSAARAEGHGGSDLYVSFPDGSGGWIAPINLGDGFNNAANEYAPSLSPDERYLFFTRHDGRRADLQWVLASALERFRPDAPPRAK